MLKAHCFIINQIFIFYYLNDESKRLITFFFFLTKAEKIFRRTQGKYLVTSTIRRWSKAQDCRTLECCYSGRRSIVHSRPTERSARLSEVKDAADPRPRGTTVNFSLLSTDGDRST